MPVVGVEIACRFRVILGNERCRTPTLGWRLPADDPPFRSSTQRRDLPVGLIALQFIRSGSANTI